MAVVLNRRALRTLAAVAGGILAVYAIVYVDVLLRARAAYAEAEKYWAWQQNPAQKAAALAAAWEREKAALEKRRKSGRISEDAYERELAAGAYEYQRQLDESAAKNAYHWYQTVIELFSPPESVWVRTARAKMPLAKERWRQELIERKIPFEEYMLD